MRALNLASRRLANLPAAAPWIAVWVLWMVLTPILLGLLGGVARPGVISVGVLLQVAAVGAVLVGAWGPARAAGVALATVGLAWGVEFLGSHTGLPFGSYSYDSLLQPQLAGVPLVVPLAWLMMLPGAWAVAASIGGRHHGPRFVILSAVAFTAWDLFLDPQMVAWGFWTWETPGSYFGIPWLNYLGWLLSSAVMTALLRPRPLPAAPLLAIYGITWALDSIGLGVIWGMPGPALVGGLAMGALFLAGWRGAGR